MVDYITRVIISLDKYTQAAKPWRTFKEPKAEALEEYGRLTAEWMGRVAAMLNILAEYGFSFKYQNDAVYADSEQIEGQAVKKLLRRHGFQDCEYQIYLEYYRQWGMM